MYRERAGIEPSCPGIAQDSTVNDLTEEIRRQFPNLAPSQVNIVVAVNADYAAPETALKSGDDVCLIPPVSGG